MNDEERNEIELQLEQLSQKWHDSWRNLHAPIPDCLFHYTSAIGLHGILSSNRLWATNISYLNDASELTYACELVKQSLESHQSRYNSEAIMEFLRRSALTFNVFEGPFDVYVTCFCEEGDLLSQWRAYGASGGGYAIGLESKMVGFRTPLASKKDFFLRKVVYDTAIQRQLVDDVINGVCSILKDTVDRHGEKQAYNVISKSYKLLSMQIAEFLFCFKSPTFVEEKEWRAVYISAVQDDLARIQFRVVAGGIVPYVELDLSPSVGPTAGKIPIEKIVHGPTLHPVLTKKALQLILRKIGYAFVEIAGSDIPLRA
jgi:hypothetical protein